MRARRRLSPTTVIACLALFFAVAGGTAIALQGRNTVDSGDIKPKAVKTSDIANSAVTTRKIRNNHVRTADIGPGAVGPADVRADPPYRLIGAPGQPAFSNGGEGDCLWANAVSPPLDLNPAGFYKDAYDVVHLVGVIAQVAGPGGDAACGGVGDESVEDQIAFVLPPGFRPQNMELHTQDSFAMVVNGSTDIPTPNGTLPAGAVFYNGSEMLLDGITYRAADPANGLPRRPAARRDANADLLSSLLD